MLAEQIKMVIECRSRVENRVERDPVGGIIVAAHPGRIDRVEHFSGHFRRLERDQLMAFQAEKNARIFGRAFAFVERLDQLLLGLLGVIIGMRIPGSIGIHRSGAGVDATGTHPARQAQRSLNGAYRFLAFGFVGRDHVLPKTSGLIEAQPFTGQADRAPAAPSLGS